MRGRQGYLRRLVYFCGEVPGMSRRQRSRHHVWTESAASVQPERGLPAVIINGYRGQVGAMPAWKGNPQVEPNIDGLYRYLPARADHALLPATPAKKGRYSADHGLRGPLNLSMSEVHVGTFIVEIQFAVTPPLTVPPTLAFAPGLPSPPSVPPTCPVKDHPDCEVPVYEKLI